VELVNGIALFGEGMIELVSRDGQWMLGHGGDTLNMAVHLARFGLPVAYASALGEDPFSEELQAAWSAEGIDCSCLLRDPKHMPGLYAIRTDDQGERKFFYWRENSAARRFFDSPEADIACARLQSSKLFVYSLISLAILDDSGRDRLLGLAAKVRAGGGKVAFDGNYRPRLWANSAEAALWRDRALAHCDIGLPTLADETELSGALDAQEVARHWRDRGAQEVVVKLGGEGCLLPDGTIVAPERKVTPVDSSGAGDSFNAGYLASRHCGHSQRESALAGHRLALWVIGRRGALPARDDSADYRLPSQR
jgi:2-dehydro-3-deoxygluconokinase